MAKHLLYCRAVRGANRGPARERSRFTPNAPHRIPQRTVREDQTHPALGDTYHVDLDGWRICYLFRQGPDPWGSIRVRGSASTSPRPTWRTFSTWMASPSAKSSTTAASPSRRGSTFTRGTARPCPAPTSPSTTQLRSRRHKRPVPIATARRTDTPGTRRRLVQKRGWL
jgi:hypothetical protein